MAPIQMNFDAVDYLTQGLICFFWGYLMGKIFGYGAYAILLTSLVALLIVVVWRM